MALQNTNKNNNNNNLNQNQSRQRRPNLSGVRRYKKGRSFADTLFGKMRYGKDLVTGKWVAIKENRKWFAQNRVSIKGDPVPEDLFKEIEMMKYLMKQSDLPINILKLLNVVEDDVYIYLVLELVDGGDFFAFIHKNHQQMEQQRQQQQQQQQQLITNNNNNINKNEIKFKWEIRMRRVFYSIVKSIRWLHFKHVCHLDISLENTLINNNDEIKIIDFGLAKYFGSNMRNNNNNNNKKVSFMMPAKRIGKPRCMSPEVFNISIYDARLADSWSVGIMLFMMLLGIPPWNMPSETETIYRMIKAGRLRDVIIYNNKQHMISSDALDLLTRLLKPENQRIYLDEVLQHPFCSNIQ